MEIPIAKAFQIERDFTKVAIEQVKESCQN